MTRLAEAVRKDKAKIKATLDRLRPFEPIVEVEPNLKPCPFCGGKAEIQRMGTGRQSMIIECVECGCSLETGETWIDEHSSWNQRIT
jgi:Lar family restriction alleviation protein